MQHFKLEEFDCNCGRANCDAKPMRDYHLSAVDSLRIAWGKALTVRSGRRCDYWNKKEGGASDSRHKYGDATDFEIRPEERYEFVALAIRHGFNGIGVGKNFVHVDSRPLGVGGVKRMWTY